MSRATGFSGAKRALKQLKSGLDVPVAAAQRTALAPVLRDSKANLSANGSVVTGKLRKLMTIRQDRSAKPGKPTAVVGPAATDPAYRSGHLVEFGTAPHFQPELNRMHPGAAAKPFLRPAFEKNRDQVIERFGAAIGPAIEKRAARLAAKGQKK
jgi:HK97 gp10 family phage protein